MDTLEITRVDPVDDERLAAWHAATDRASRHGREATANVLRLEEMRPLMREPSRTWAFHAFAASVDGAVLATAFAELPLLDNLQLAELSVCVVPEARRRGHGSELLTYVESELRALGRSTITGEVTWPIGSDASGRGSAGVDFAVRHGFGLGLREVQRHLALPVAESLLDELAAAAAPHHAAYRLVSFSGPLPEEYLLGWCRLDSSLVTEAPMGDLEREPATVDTGAQRDAEARIEAQGRTRFTTLALDPTGEVVAYTDLGVTLHEPDRAYQWGTLVRADHRGHRLGAALKVANLRRLQTAHPELVRLATWNAEENSHMVGVNELLGFVPVEWAGSFQKHLA